MIFNFTIEIIMAYFPPDSISIVKCFEFHSRESCKFVFKSRSNSEKLTTETLTRNSLNGLTNHKWFVLTLSPHNELSSASVFKVLQYCSKLMKMLSNSLDPGETQSYLASHPDPSCLRYSTLVVIGRHSVKKVYHHSSLYCLQ